MKEIIELTLEELIKKYDIQNKEEIDTLKSGKEFIDNTGTIKNENSRYRVCSALIEYLLYKMNGGE